MLQIYLNVQLKCNRPSQILLGAGCTSRSVLAEQEAMNFTLDTACAS